MKIIFFLIASIILLSCKTDLTTQYLKKNNVTSSSEILGLKLLNDAREAVQIQNILKFKTYKVILKDCFFGVEGQLANPYKDKCTTFELLLRPHINDGYMKFNTGKEKGNVYGIENQKTYEIVDQQQVFKKNKRTEFWLQTYQYFIEFPLRITEADKITYAGEETYKNQKYNLVMASWYTLKPQKKIDQYLIWISKKTNRIEIIQYTIRDVSTLIKGTNFLTDYKFINGIWFPTQMKVSSLFKQKSQKWDQNRLLHQMEIKAIEFVN